MKKVSNSSWMAILVGIALLIGSCEGNTYIKPKTQELDISESVIVDFIDEAVSKSTMGLGYEIWEAGNLAKRFFDIQHSNYRCGSKVDSIIDYAYANETNTLGYEGSCDWTVFCNTGSTIAAIEFNMNLFCDHLGEGIPRLTTTSCTSHWTISQDVGANVYLLNGDYLRDGYYKTGIPWDHSYYYQLNYEGMSLAVDLLDLNLLEAKVYFEGYIKEVTITGLGPIKEIEGYVHFMDSENAKIIIEDRSYDIDLK